MGLLLVTVFLFLVRYGKGLKTIYTRLLKNVKLTAVETKTLQCERIYEAIKRLERVEIEEIEILNRELDIFEACLENARITLSRKLGFIQASPKRSFSGKVKNVMALGGLTKSVERIQAIVTKEKMYVRISR